MRHVRYIFSIIAVLLFLSANAQTVQVNLPSEVMVGENFRLKYTVNNTDVKDIRIGKLPAEIELIYGPSMSVQRSLTSVNGHASTSSTIGYTYVLSASKKGSFTIPEATIWLDNGKTIRSQKRTVRVVDNPYGGQSQGGQSQGRSSQRRAQQSTKYAGDDITSKDLFIKVSTNKNKVYEQEPVLLTYKVYSAVDLTQLDVKMPDVAGFLTEEIALPRGRSFSIENIGGRIYRTATWSKYVLYPQKSGNLEIPSLTFNGVVMQRERNVDPFEAFFNGGGYVEVNKKIKAPSLTLHVEPLPERPDNFSGAVGKFDISAKLDKEEIKANNAVTLSVEISGHGNMKLITCPEPELPNDFDKYDPRTTDKTQLTEGGASGSMIYDFIIVPRNMGKYEIPALEFTYFDSSEKKYKTLKTQKFVIDVQKGDGKSSSVDDFSNLKDRDIRGIKKGSAEHRSADRLFFGSTSYWIVLIITSLIFIALLIIFRRRAIENADIVKLKGKRANSVAVKRLRKADKLMKAGRDGEFFDEVLRALWGYVSDKLNMPSEKLLRENVEENLLGSGVGEQTVRKFIEALDECEFERYAPGDKGVSMNKTFDSAMTAIMEIETDMRNKKKNKSSKSLVILMLLMLVPCTMNAGDKIDADALYSNGNYKQAVVEYENLLQEGESAELYYNLGNAYYRLNNITRAVINYERALLLSPGDRDIKFNLEMARSKTADKMASSSEMFFVTFYKALVNTMSVDGWAITAVVSIILSLILILLYLFSSHIMIRKIGFFGSAILLVLFLFSNLFAFQQKEQITNRTGAVVISSSTEVRKTPSDTSTELMEIHEGTHVDIKDATMKEWFGVKLSDGTEGWVRKEAVEVI